MRLRILTKWFTYVLSGTMGLFFVLLIASFGSVFWVRRDVPAGVTAANVERVRCGMNATQVMAVLGRPLSIYSYKGSGTHDMATCHGTANREGVVDVEVSDTMNVVALLRRATADTAVHACDIGDFRAHDRNTTFTYSRPVAVAGRYPMLWVMLDSTAHVSQVSVKGYTPYFFLEDDNTEYLATANPATNPYRKEILRQLFGR
ncbi:hypothetical protein [Hymenobacter negativus]|uniref:Uncharacterized protein n=1 Tax=Hymenobacter negativus TaxID=2795026 RepID=A0ABS0Q7U8_9BACT|nr:hypothetical protein [Hymenobacter negativus]MBH8558438.1 hypothetical protein [Hymenobacter negativus]